MPNKGKARIHTRFGKKAVDMSLNSVILGVVFIIIMVKAAPIMYTLLFSKSDIETCRMSVAAKSLSIKIASFGTSLVDPVQLHLECHTGFLVAKKGGVYDKNKKLTDFSESKFQGKDLQYKLKTGIADRMRDCWYMFQNGERDPFSRLGGDNHCVECYEIVFDNDVKSEVKTLDDFSGFLNVGKANTKDTYLKYLYGTEVENAKELPRIDLDTTKSYAVTYYRNTFSVNLAKTAFGASTALGCVGGAVVGVQVGGIAGTVVPGAGNVVGAIFGGGVGCAAGLVTGIIAADKVSGIGKSMGVSVVDVEKLGKDCEKLY